MEKAPETVAAVGFRAHTGWAAAVVVTRQWQIIERRRIVYEPEATRFIYHHASEIAADADEALIETARIQATARARREIESVIATVRRDGKAIVAAGVPGGNYRLPGVLSEILAAHSRIHAAEGAFYRNVLADACERMHLRVNRTPERDLRAATTKSLGCTDTALRDRLDAVGRKVGPPWAEDQKLAALAAFTALL
ncbi:MAG TPA: hypothetical protein VKR31_01560 [Rhizomicrobium sp.]|nr:hypothetical protein [Rhizomicrobium sp.]